MAYPEWTASCMESCIYGNGFEYQGKTIFRTAVSKVTSKAADYEMLGVLSGYYRNYWNERLWPKNHLSYSLSPDSIHRPERG